MGPCLLPGFVDIPFSRGGEKHPFSRICQTATVKIPFWYLINRLLLSTCQSWGRGSAMCIWISLLFQPNQPLVPNIPYMALGKWLSFQAVLPLKGIKEPIVFSVCENQGARSSDDSWLSALRGKLLLLQDLQERSCLFSWL